MLHQENAADCARVFGARPNMNLPVNESQNSSLHSEDLNKMRAKGPEGFDFKLQGTRNQLVRPKYEEVE